MSGTETLACRRKVGSDEFNRESCGRPATRLLSSVPMCERHARGVENHSAHGSKQPLPHPSRRSGSRS